MVAKFQVDIPEDPEVEEDEKVGFSFRDADPVGVGTGEDVPKSEDFNAREHSLAAGVSIGLGLHDRLQKADSQLFILSEWMGELKKGAKIRPDAHGSAKEMVDIIRTDLVTALVALDHILHLMTLEEQGVLGDQDVDQGFAELAVSLMDRTVEELERWGLSTTHLDDIPEKAKDLLAKAREVAAAKAASNE